MNTRPDSTIASSILRTVTDTWPAQVGSYVALLVIFFLIDQLIVADMYRNYFHSPGTIFNLLFLVGDWIPGFANVLVMTVSRRSRAMLAYLATSAVLTCVLSIAYYFLTGQDMTYGNDPMHLGYLGLAIFWMFAWFLGGVIGLTTNFMIWGKMAYQLEVNIVYGDSRL